LEAVVRGGYLISSITKRRFPTNVSRGGCLWVVEAAWRSDAVVSHGVRFGNVQVIGSTSKNWRGREDESSKDRISASGPGAPALRWRDPPNPPAPWETGSLCTRSSSPRSRRFPSSMGFARGRGVRERAKPPATQPQRRR